MRNRCAAASLALALAGAAAAQSGWTQMFPPIAPSARASPGLAYDLPRTKTVLFGGFISNPNYLTFADTWEWNGTNWSQRTTANSPPARWGHAFASWHSVGRIVLFGGRDQASASLGDTWEYDGVDWTQRLPANWPAPRQQVRMAFDPTSGSMLLFGGGSGAFSMSLGDTWRWNGTTWTQLNPPTSPPARFGHGMTEDLVGGRIVMWGGFNVPGLGALDDTWIWNGSDWSQVVTASAPPAFSDLPVVHDAASDCVVLGGGTQTWLFDGASWRSDPRPGGPSIRVRAGVTYDFVRSRTILFGGGLLPPHYNDTWEYAPGVVARWTPLGSGCAGSAGVPLLRPNGASLPIIGTTLVLEVVNLAATSPVAAITFGFSATTWNAQPLPMSLGGFGMPGCSLHASPDVLFFVPVANGQATFAWSLPNDPGLIGTRFWNQALAVEPGINAAGAVVANAGAGIIGPF